MPFQNFKFLEKYSTHRPRNIDESLEEPEMEESAITWPAWYYRLHVWSEPSSIIWRCVCQLL